MIQLLKECGSIESCSNRVASVALIACCLFRILGIKHPLRQEATATLLDMLTLTDVDIENKSCLGIDFLLNGFPTELRYFVFFNVCLLTMIYMWKKISLCSAYEMQNL